MRHAWKISFQRSKILSCKSFFFFSSWILQIYESLGLFQLFFAKLTYEKGGFFMCSWLSPSITHQAWNRSVWKMGTSLALSEAAFQDTSCLRRSIQVWRFGFSVYWLEIPFRVQVWMVILAAFLINGFNPFLNKINNKKNQTCLLSVSKECLLKEFGVLTLL